VNPGSASSAVSVAGKFGGTPKVSIPTPLYAKAAQRSTVIEGKGATIGGGETAVVDLNWYDGKTGKLVGPANFALTVGEDGPDYPGLAKSLQCTNVGSRVVVSGSTGVLLGPTTAKQVGVAASSPAVFVIDVHRAFPSRANGAPQPAQPGFPTVVLAPNGQPGIKINDSAEPKVASHEVLKKGSGAVVRKGDVLVVKYTAVQWSDNSVLDSSWKNGSAAFWQAGGTTDKNLTVSKAPAGTLAALLGQRVGSQVVVKTPATSGTSGSPASAWVVDILGIYAHTSA
jgi:peptidylprolyl isomerase